MGVFKVTIEIDEPRGERFEPIDVLVDAGGACDPLDLGAFELAEDTPKCILTEAKRQVD